MDALRRQTYRRTPTTRILAMPITTDIDFARRSVDYLIKNKYRADQIVRVLTDELGLDIDTAHLLVSETAELVAA